MQRSADSKPTLIVSRVFDAPRELVFEVWTRVEHFSRWFGPHGAEMIGCELDARGIIRFGHRIPERTVYVNGTFTEVVKNERLVFNFAFVDEQGVATRPPMFANWPLDASIETIVTLQDEGSGTKVTVAHRVLPPDAASHPAAKR